MFLKISGELVKHLVVLGCLFVHYIRKGLYHWEKTHASVILFLDGKQSMGNFDTPYLHRFSRLKKIVCAQKATVKCLSDN